MEFEKEVLQQINDTFRDIRISEPLDDDLMQVIDDILEKKPCHKLERMWRNYQDYLFEIGSDPVLFAILLKEVNRHMDLKS